VAVTNIMYTNASMHEVIRQKFYIHLLISGFHHASLQSVTFIRRLNALDYTKIRS